VVGVFSDWEACRSYAPTSQEAPWGTEIPRWSVPEHAPPVQKLSAAEPEYRGMVWVAYPWYPKVPNFRSASATRAEFPAPADAGDWVTPVHDPSVTRLPLFPDMVCNPLQMSVVLPAACATMVWFSVRSPKRTVWPDGASWS
jgi:hypothetical protein